MGVLPKEQTALEYKQTLSVCCISSWLRPQSYAEKLNTTDVTPFLSHSDPNSISLSEQHDHKQLNLRFQNHGIPVAKTNTALWLCKPF